MPTKHDPPITPNARSRRTARRATATSAARGRNARPARGRSPILPITLLVGIAGIVLVGALVLVNGGAPAKADPAALVAPASATPTELADGRSLGRANAPVTLDLWSDFQCPVCGEFARTVEPALIAKYVPNGTLRFIHHDAAFQGAKSGAAYDESVEAGAGARCAADQARYWPYQDWTFANQGGENQGAFAAARLKAIATAAGLDVTAWSACIATGRQQTAVRAETTQGVAQGVNATPTMVINGKRVVGLHGVAELSAIIDAAAAAAAGG